MFSFSVVYSPFAPPFGAAASLNLIIVLTGDPSGLLSAHCLVLGGFRANLSPKNLRIFYLQRYSFSSISPTKEINFF